MRLPPALALPLDRLDSRQRRVFFGLSTAALLLVLGWAACVRFAWPQWPLSDSDTWGYLNPALSKLTGQGFVHTYGRNFVYPGWVYLLLRCTGTFQAIPVAQHLLGLATGALLWTAWRQWRGWFTASRLPAGADALLGLGLVLFFLRSASVIRFEHLIRPEAIFACFAALDMCLLLAFLRAWFVDRHPVRAALLGGASVFDATLLLQLKPSFGLAVGFALLPVAWAFLHPWATERRPRWLLAAAVATAAVAVLFAFVLPERQLAKTDNIATLFLPETLLTVHADIIRDQMMQDVRDHAPSPFPDAFRAAAAERMEHETQLAAQPGEKPYPSLGFNPDHLMYHRDSVCRWLYETLPIPQVAKFCFYYYERAALHQPGRMIAKVLRQLRVFYNIHCPAFWPERVLKEAALYSKATVALANPNYQSKIRAYPPGGTYVVAAERLQASTTIHRQPAWTVIANVMASVCYLPLLGLFVAGMAWVSRWNGERRTGLWAAGWLLLMVYGLNFGNCLTIAVVHSQDVARYSYNLLVYAAWCEVAVAVWLVEVGSVWAIRRWK